MCDTNARNKVSSAEGERQEGGGTGVKKEKAEEKRERVTEGKQDALVLCYSSDGVCVCVSATALLCQITE